MKPHQGMFVICTPSIGLCLHSPAHRTQVRARLISHHSNSSPVPGEFCCFVPSSREWAQLKLKQVLIKTSTILQTGLLITVKICQGKLRRGRKIVISCATYHFHLITITLFCRERTSVLHNKLLSWGLVWIESCEALPWVLKLAA